MVVEENRWKTAGNNRKTNKTRIAPNEEVDFSLIVENKGNRAITGVSKDWTGKEILTKDSWNLKKGNNICPRVEPERIHLTATGVEEGTGRNVQASYTAKFSAIEAELEITNRVTPRN